MKKYRFYLLMFGLLIVITFNSCKDDEDPKPQNSNKLKSKSFEVTLLTDSASGYFQNYSYYNSNYLPLKCNYIVRNTTNDTIRYHIKIEAIESVPTHWIEQCMELCVSSSVNSMFGFMGVWQTPPNYPQTFFPQGETLPDGNSYMKMWAGEHYENTISGTNKFKVTYTNANDATDFVSFILAFYFTEAVSE